MKKFDGFMDLTGKGRTLDCNYHGNQRKMLEGRILEETDNELVVGVSLWEDMVASNNYDPQRKSLDVWYQPMPGQRAAVFMLTEFNVPKDIKEINVYDLGQKVK
ncbi:MAG: hypothetical protein V1729_06390 [Candidatus Woesearchaeota archaeon]